MSGNDNQNSEDQPPLAIEYSSDNTSRPLRQPSNLQGLLRYVVEAGSRAAPAPNQESPNNERPIQRLTQENNEFLLNAINSMLVNVGQELSKHIKTLKENQKNEELCTDAIDGIGEYVINADYANDFLKAGGHMVFELCFQSKYKTVRYSAADLFASIVQNNEIGQNMMLNLNYLNKLLIMIGNDPHEDVRVQCFYALSCLIRNHEKGLNDFISQDGISLIFNCFQSSNDKLITKAAFLMSSIISSDSNIKDTICSMNRIEQLISLLTIDNAQKDMMEHILLVLALLTDDHPELQNKCKQIHLNLRHKLSELKKKNCSDDAYAEQIEYINRICSNVFCDEVDNDIEVEDR